MVFLLFIHMYVIEIEGWVLVFLREKSNSIACLSESKYIFHCCAQCCMCNRSWFKIIEVVYGSFTTSDTIVLSTENFTCEQQPFQDHLMKTRNRSGRSTEPLGTLYNHYVQHGVFYRIDSFGVALSPSMPFC